MRRIVAMGVGLVGRRAAALVGVAGLSLAWSAPSLAEIPAVLDRVPTEAIVIVATPSLDRFDRNMKNLIAATEMSTLSTPSQMLTVLGLGAGLDLTRPAALALMEGDPQSELPPIVLLAPVTDYKAMLDAFGATPAADGVTEFQAAGETMYARSLDDNYAAIGLVKDLVAGFDASKGRMAAHAAAIGGVGSDVASASDMVVIVQAQPFLAAYGNADMLAGPLGAMTRQAGFEPGTPDAMKPVIEAAKRDAQTAIIGTRAGSMGLNLDVAVNFRPDTEMAKACVVGGSTAGMLKNVPSDPFLIAYAIDLSKGGLKDLLKVAKAGGEGDPMGGGALVSLIERLEGQAGAIYPNPAGFMGGLLARGVFYYKTSDPVSFAGEFKAWIEKINGSETGGLGAETTYTAGSAQVDGATLDAYSIRIAPRAARVGSPMGIFYGPQNGPAGHIASTKEGVYTTTTPDTALMAKALAAGKGEGLAGDGIVRQVGGMLPEPRTGELYVGVKSILDQASAFMALAGRPMAAPPPADLPPLGFGLIVDGGGARIASFLPAPTIKAVSAIAANAGAPGGASKPRPATNAPANQGDEQKKTAY